MPRRRKRRRCRHLDDRLVYKPRAIPFDELEVSTLGLDEFEALRLCDLEGHDQTAAGEAMGVSRGTVQRLLKRGRRTLVEALLLQRALIVGSAAENVDGRSGPPPTSSSIMRSDP